jgi:hypothetical protein
MLPLNKCQLWAQTGQAGSQTGQTGSTETGQTGSQNRSGRFHTADHTSPKDKNAKEMHKLPNDFWDRFHGCNATFLHFSPPFFLPLVANA